MEQALSKRIDEQIVANWSEQLEFLREMVMRPSTLGNEAPVQQVIASELTRMGFEPQTWDVDHAAIAKMPGYSLPEWSYQGRPNVTARWPSDTHTGRSLILNGHIDVVPIGPEHFWTFDPFGAEVRDGRMYGRGAADMKSGVAAMIYAVRALRDLGLELAGDVTIQSVIEEECTGNGTLATLAKGIEADAVIIPEPFQQTALVSQVGVMWARVTVRGAGAHVQGADRAVNAFMKSRGLIDAIVDLERIVNEEPKHPSFRDAPHPLNYNVGVVHSGDWPSSVPSECTFEVRISAYPGADLDAVQRRFREHLLAAARRDDWLAEHPPEIAFFGFRAEGCVVDPDQPLFEVLGRAHRQVMGTDLQLYNSTATTDVRFFDLYANTPATCYGPVGGNLHAPDEWVDLDSVLDTTRVLAAAIVDWCGVD